MAHGQKKLRRVVVGSAVTLALAVIIAVVTLAPMPAGGPAGSDKVYHVLAFACLAFPLPLVRPRSTLWVVVGVIAYGGAIEVIQPFFGRQAEWADFVADAIGAILGAVVARQLGLWRPRSGGSNEKDDPLSEAWLKEGALPAEDDLKPSRSGSK